MPEESLRTALVRLDVLTGPWSLRGGLSPGKHRRKAGKCDSLSFLGVSVANG